MSRVLDRVDTEELLRVLAGVANADQCRTVLERSGWFYSNDSTLHTRAQECAAEYLARRLIILKEPL
jgi:hypothetical protein